MIDRKLPWFAAAVAIAAAGVAAQHFLFPAQPATAAPVELRSAQFWDASLPDLAERRQPLSQWLGKVVVVNFWAPWCPPCRTEIPGFIGLQERLGKQGLQFVGVALDDADKVKAFADGEGINYPILLGGSEAVQLGQVAGNRLGGLPYTVVFDRKGNAIAGLTGAVSPARLEALLQPLL